MGDDKLLIRNLVVKWAGKTHDSRSWKNCEAKAVLEAQTQFAIAGWFITLLSAKNRTLFHLCML